MKKKTEVIELIEVEADFTSDLAGFAATDAVKTLLANWKAVIQDGNSCDLVSDVLGVIQELRRFEKVARNMLPVAYGGFAGKPVDYWVDRLDEIGVSIYESADEPGNYGFTGCDCDDYTTEDAAVSAALLYNLPDADANEDASRLKMKG